MRIYPVEDLEARGVSYRPMIEIMGNRLLINETYNTREECDERCKAIDQLITNDKERDFVPTRWGETPDED